MVTNLIHYQGDSHVERRTSPHPHTEETHHEAHHPNQRGEGRVRHGRDRRHPRRGQRRRRLRPSAASAGPVSYSTEAFRETIRPWDSITIPALSCPTGYLENQDYSPAASVPEGVEILEPDAIGVTILEVKSTLVTDWWNTPHYPVTRVLLTSEMARSRRSRISTPLGTKLVVVSITPGISSQSFGSGLARSASYSCWWRGLANSMVSAPALAW